MAKTGPGQGRDLNEALAGVEYPASREALIRHARGQGMDDQIIETLNHMPRDSYRSLDDVMKDIGDND